MGYDNMHRIPSKKQHLTQSNVQFNDVQRAIKQGQNILENDSIQ
ncbi:hypothetical protein HMPREF1870_01721 [Bacteroidales bacterium KA00344]|nr:hypothetical protein HMPREF1870_01721 [Bacteroidales bacterium KA00344]